MFRRPPELPNEFLGPCPVWCGDAHAPEEAWGDSQFHATQPLYLHVELSGVVYRIGEAYIIAYPGAADPLRRLPFLFLDIRFDDYELSPEETLILATALGSFLEQVRQLADQLARIRADDRAAKAWRT